MEPSSCDMIFLCIATAKGRLVMCWYVSIGAMVQGMHRYELDPRKQQCQLRSSTPWKIPSFLMFSVKECWNQDSRFSPIWLVTVSSVVMTSLNGGNDEEVM